MSASMEVEVIPFGGWMRNLRLANQAVEATVTLEVGPRVLFFGPRGGQNMLRLFESEAGGRGEGVFRSRGGHRLWLAPESPDFSYSPDNAPVAHERLGPLSVRLTPPAEERLGFQKQVDLTLDPRTAGATLVHRVRNIGSQPRQVAPWAITVLLAGGTAILPQPPLGEHPRDLLPNRHLVSWAYTDLGDPRLRLGSRFVLLRQERRGPTKIGQLVTEGWAGYLREDMLFAKGFGDGPMATFPDRGCNCEVFTNEDMLELESLGPLRTLAPGEATEHTERWYLFAGVRLAAPGEAGLAEALRPLDLPGVLRT